MEGREYREKLKEAVERRAAYPAKYLHTQPLRIAVDGQVVWKGKVEVFQLNGHPQAQLAFGWSILNDRGNTEFVTVVGVPPLETPVMAVKAYLASRKE